MTLDSDSSGSGESPMETDGESPIPARMKQKRIPAVASKSIQDYFRKPNVQAPQPRKSRRSARRPPEDSEVQAPQPPKSRVRPKRRSSESKIEAPQPSKSRVPKKRQPEEPEVQVLQPPNSRMPTKRQAEESEVQVLQPPKRRFHPIIVPEPKVLPWVEKYRPASLEQLAGLQGDQSAMRKLFRWLMDWPRNHTGAAANVKKAKPGPYSSQGDGSAFKAALLSGPPGIGKTTCAVLCCQQLNVDYRETNASVARNKKAVAELWAGDENIERFVHKDYGMVSEASLKTRTKLTGVEHVLIMDEVDGISGNADRAGMAELVQIIKRTSVPIICICNDRSKAAIRNTLTNYCYDLRFQRPRVEQIKVCLSKIAAAEKVSIAPTAVDQIIEASHHDIRQCINALQLYATGLATGVGGRGSAPRKLRFESKDVATGTFDSAQALLGSGTSLLEKLDKFFDDYAAMPLFVHENYPAVLDKKVGKSEQLSRLRRAADSIAMGDVVEKQVRTHQQWNLLQDQGMLSCVLPSLFLNGHMTKKIEFPQWFGKNSNAQKMHRLARQLTVHVHSKLACGNQAIVEECLPVLRERMYRPLVKGDSSGVQDALPVFLHYNLQKDDIDAINELGPWPGKHKDIFQSVSSKAKSALTRALNKESRKAPAASNTIVSGAVGRGKKKAALQIAADDDDGEEAPDEQLEEEVPTEEILYN